MRPLLILLTGLSTITPLAAETSSRYSTDLTDPILTRCTVTVKNELQIPAQDAGVLKEVFVKKGDTVVEGAPLGKIDDTDALIQKSIAESARDRAKAEAENEINVEYSTAAAGVEKMVLKKAQEANARAGGRNPPYPLSEIRRLQLNADRAGFQIDQARMDKSLAKLDQKVREAELEGVNKALARLEINAPFAGTIVRAHWHKGEWVQPGHPIFWIMQFDTMKVNGSVDGTQYDPSDVEGKPVTVTVERARGRVVTLTGYLTHVSPIISSDKVYKVEAEVANIKENGHWLVPHGASATMTIHVK